MDLTFNTFQKKAIIKYLLLDYYKYINENLQKCDISSDVEFQTKFNAFFKVRRNENWRKNYYKYFQRIKNNKDIKFEDILLNLSKENSIEASFSSKMLAIINPDMPIWDKNVLDFFKLKINGHSKSERIKSTIDNYYKIINMEKELLNDKNVLKSIKEFKELFYEYNISDIKALDYLIWNSKGESSNEQ